MRTHRRGQRYERGQKVYILGWGVLDTPPSPVFSPSVWPYYEVLATNDASVWLVPRLHCSTIPLPVL